MDGHNLSLTNHQKDLVREHFVTLIPQIERVASLFYERLFTQYPEVKPLFDDVDLDEQSKKLFQMLSLIVGLLDDEEELVLTLHDLGDRHIIYGVQPEQYRPFGEALLWALATSSGDRFTPELREAWTTIYNRMAILVREVYQST
jgi:methyl-accepting chemotaxis protein